MKIIALVLAAALTGGAANAQTVVEKLDPGLDVLVAPDTKVEKLVEDQDAFFEGPVWHHGRDGNFLTFSDLVRNRVNRLDPRTHQISTYIADVWQGKDSSSAISFDRNGKKYLQVGPNGETSGQTGPAGLHRDGFGQDHAPGTGRHDHRACRQVRRPPSQCAQ